MPEVVRQRPPEAGPKQGDDPLTRTPLCWLDEGELVPRQAPGEDRRPWMEAADDWLAARRGSRDEDEREDPPMSDDEALSSLSWI